ncbi:TetR/AcrR family transcriptional regulator [Actinomadura luteofluorescens]|uniref:TetR/AcrR family transcriptional regulator n=1 Tax=Actinomadura luteofluorescens TaxID=46163 RepID=UPI003639B381
MARIATREKLFTAAIELIAESGLAATTVDQIAERAGVAKGTVYYNFDSKAALFAALLEYGVDRLATALRDAASGRPPLEALDAVVAAELAFVGEHESFARLLIAETWRAAATGSTRPASSASARSASWPTSCAKRSPRATSAPTWTSERPPPPSSAWSSPSPWTGAPSSPAAPWTTSRRPSWPSSEAASAPDQASVSLARSGA